MRSEVFEGCLLGQVGADSRLNRERSSRWKLCDLSLSARPTHTHTHTGMGITRATDRFVWHSTTSACRKENILFLKATVKETRAKKKLQFRLLTYAFTLLMPFMRFDSPSSNPYSPLFLFIFNVFFLERNADVAQQRSYLLFIVITFSLFFYFGNLLF